MSYTATNTFFLWNKWLFGHFPHEMRLSTVFSMFCKSLRSGIQAAAMLPQLEASAPLSFTNSIASHTTGHSQEFQRNFGLLGTLHFGGCQEVS